MAPHPHCWVLAPTQKQPHRWPGHAPGAPGATQRSGWAQPWASKPPISEGNLQRISPFLCALFFVLLKFSPPCRWPPPPAQPRKGAEAWGVRNPDPAKKLHRGDQPGEGPLIVYAGWTGRFLWSRWPQERGGSDAGAKNGHRGRRGGPWGPVRLQGVTTRKESALYFPSILPGRERGWQLSADKLTRSDFKING